MKSETNLVWIDLEMTGLYPEQHVILEIATIVTDAQLNTIEEQEPLAIHHEPQVLEGMDSWAREQHGKSGLLAEVRASSITLEQAEKETLALVARHCAYRTAPLCGNSVWQDRAFMRRYMPDLTSHLHYRIVDVTSFKEVVSRWYPGSVHAEFKKQERHRALDDIKESIAELKHYRRHFFM